MKRVVLSILIIIMVLAVFKNRNTNTNENKKTDYLEMVNKFIGKIPKFTNKNKKVCQFVPKITKFYKPYIIDKPKLNEIVYTLICDINKKKNEKFVLLNYDSGTIISFPNGDTRYIIRAFVFNKKNGTSRKVEIDLLIIKKLNSIKLFSIKLGKSLNNLDKLPESTTNENLNRSKFTNLSENVDISLDYSLLSEFSETPDNSVKCEESKNIRGFHNFPCRKVGDWWDTSGITDIEPETDKCYGVNSTNKKRINILDDLNVTRKNNNKYSWLHSLDTGIPSFPNSNFSHSGRYG